MANNKNTKHCSNVHYTRPEWVDKTISVFKKAYPDYDGVLYDPFGGGGAFLDGFKRAGHKGLATDIAPGRDDVGLLDIKHLRGDITCPVITNPPFSRNIGAEMFNYLADRRCPYITMLWPQSYRKETRQSLLDPQYHLVCEEAFTGLASSFFETDTGKKSRWNMCVQVYERRGDKRTPPRRPPQIIQKWKVHRKYGERMDDLEWKFGTMGFSAGKLVRVKANETKPKNTWVYLRNDTPRWLLKALDEHHWPTKDWVCQATSKSLSLTEINRHLSMTRG